MEKIVPYYLKEMAHLEEASREFAKRYPKIASRLSMSDGLSEDPHVERLMQSFALMCARISRKLEDDYPEFTDAFLEAAYPHFLRPFPSCSIVQFGDGVLVKPLLIAPSSLPAVEATELPNTTITIPRGTQLSSETVQNAICQFKTVYDVNLAPIQIASATYYSQVQAPSGTRLPPDATGCISITVTSPEGKLAFEQWGLKKIRLYMDGEPLLVNALRDCLFIKGCAFFIQVDDSPRWMSSQNSYLSEVGYSDLEALIPYSKQGLSPYRLLTEYFAFPDKFNFVDIDLKFLLSSLKNTSKVTFHVVINQLHADTNTARLLESLTPKNLRLGCTPIVNLVEKTADSIDLTQNGRSYPVTVSEKKKSAYEVYSINAVSIVSASGTDQVGVPVYQLYSLNHGDVSFKDGHYWTAQKNELTNEQKPGFETEISLEGFDYDHIDPTLNTLSMQLTCTNRDLPLQLVAGSPQGELRAEGGESPQKAKLLKTPTRRLYFERGRFKHWEVISNLTVNHLTLEPEGLPALKMMLKLYNLQDSAVSSQQIIGIVDINFKPAMTWMSFEPRGCFIRGIEIHVTINEDGYVTSGMHGFIRVLDHFFGLYVHRMSFIQLVIFSDQTKKEIMRCAPRSGVQALA